MIKGFQIGVSLVVLGLVVGVIRFVPTSVFALGSTTVDQHRAQFSFVTQEQQPEKTFTGKIAQMDGKYILRDPSSQSTYQLDDQDKAKQFDGQRVKVTGKLDENTKTIHVSNIEPA